MVRRGCKTGGGVTQWKELGGGTCRLEGDTWSRDNACGDVWSRQWLRDRKMPSVTFEPTLYVYTWTQYAKKTTVGLKLKKKKYCEKLQLTTDNN